MKEITWQSILTIFIFPAITLMTITIAWFVKRLIAQNDSNIINFSHNLNTNSHDIKSSLENEITNLHTIIENHQTEVTHSIETMRNCITEMKDYVTNINIRLERVAVSNENLNERLKQSTQDFTGFTNEVKEVYKNSITMDAKIKTLESEVTKLTHAFWRTQEHGLSPSVR